jgi:hypothetical protein
LDRHDDEFHEEHNADQLPTPEEQRHEKEKGLDDFAED